MSKRLMLIIAGAVAISALIYTLASPSSNYARFDEVRPPADEQEAFRDRCIENCG